jgi:hypothetical protein
VLTLTGVGTLSSCAKSSVLTYYWTVTDSNGLLVTNKTASPTPSIFTAVAYTFSAGMLYTATLKVTSGVAGDLYRSSSYATVGVFVNHGVVVAAVRGAYIRQVFIDLHIGRPSAEYSKLKWFSIQFIDFSGLALELGCLDIIR